MVMTRTCWQDDESDVQSYYGSTIADDMPSSDAVFDTGEFDRSMLPMPTASVS